MSANPTGQGAIINRRTRRFCLPSTEALNYFIQLFSKKNKRGNHHKRPVTMMNFVAAQVCQML
jgi:hypothetical protein